jgi:hypothetical protein
MEHAQEAIEEFYNRPAKSQRNIKCDENITFFFNGVGNYTNVPHQVASEINVKDF